MRGSNQKNKHMILLLANYKHALASVNNSLNLPHLASSSRYLQATKEDTHFEHAEGCVQAGSSQSWSNPLKNYA
jgi:hypothetical protein